MGTKKLYDAPPPYDYVVDLGEDVHEVGDNGVFKRSVKIIKINPDRPHQPDTPHQKDISFFNMHGHLHREDGPAKILLTQDGEVENMGFYLHGTFVDTVDYKLLMAVKELCSEESYDYCIEKLVKRDKFGLTGAILGPYLDEALKRNIKGD